jgi:hypothetical protein
MNILERYGPAMEIRDKAQSEAYFELLVRTSMAANASLSRKDAEQMERDNLGYFAGYYDQATGDRVFELFGAEHPIYGRRRLSPSELFAWGEALGALMRDGVDAAEAVRRVHDAIAAEYSPKEGT